jgi:hypothetical protein
VCELEEEEEERRRRSLQEVSVNTKNKIESGLV